MTSLAIGNGHGTSMSVVREEEAMDGLSGAFTDFSNEQEDLQDLAEENGGSGNGSSNGKFKTKYGLVLVGVFCSAIGFALTTYFLMRSKQEAQFETAFEIFARETAVIADNHAENTFGQLQSLAQAITSMSMEPKEQQANTSNNKTFTVPFVSIPHFDLRTQDIVNRTGIEMLLYLPFVPKEDRLDWEVFQNEHLDWIFQEKARQGLPASSLGEVPPLIHPFVLPEDYNDTRRGFVDDGFMEQILANKSWTVQAFTTPIAQYGPGVIDPSIAKLDLFSHPLFKKEIMASLEYDVPVISEHADTKFLLDTIQTQDDQERDYSLLRSFTLDRIKENFSEDSRTIGYIMGIIQWKSFFRTLLPEDINGIVVKVASDCGRNMTYIVNGGKDDQWDAQHDLHDPDYDYLEQRFKFFWKNHPKGTSRHCHFDLLITPNEDFAEPFRSNAPIVWAAIVLVVFLTGAALFFAYDFWMQKKHNKTAAEKARAQSIVQSLFPKDVGDKLMEEKATLEESKKQKQADSWKQLPERTFNNVKPSGKPLAELFPSATIMFADIAGFTAWSASREPTQVFMLLETIYSSFDATAKRRKVFKIETIGDCYVAVVGLPDPCENHAVVMGKFAKACLEDFEVIVRDLAEELGEGTVDLKLRTGLHTGPVTAGVIRGERARFQLFGDSVNTTSRIESLGEGGRIHVSQEYADELIRFNKEHWLLPREDKVEAKGKGLLTTYWLQMQSARSYASRVSSTGSYHPTSLHTSRLPGLHSAMEEVLQDESLTQFDDSHGDASHVFTPAEYDTLVEC